MTFPSRPGYSGGTDAEAVGPPSADPSGDCRTEEGVIVGLIDGVIAQSRVVARYLRQSRPVGGVAEALADLRSDEDVALLVGAPSTALGVTG